jgi:hypothetical protein
MGKYAVGLRMTELEFLLRTARALVSTFPEKATNFVLNSLGQTVDPRLRYLIGLALSALERKAATAAGKWLGRACEYERARRDNKLRSPRAPVTPFEPRAPAPLTGNGVASPSQERGMNEERV